MEFNMLVEFISCVVVAFSGTFLIDLISNHRDKISTLIGNFNYKKKERRNKYRLKCLRASLEFKDIIDKNKSLTRKQRTHFLDKISTIITSINDPKTSADIDFKRMLEILFHEYKQETGRFVKINAHNMANTATSTWTVVDLGK